MKKNKFIFLDRDGVINKYPGDKKYVTSLKKFHFLKGSLEAIRLLTKEGYRICVVSNQAGVGKGIYSKKTLASITRFMMRSVKKTKGRFYRVSYCTHRTDAKCSCRKPHIGLLKLATRGTKIERKKSYFIGDSILDVKTGKKFGLKTILVFSGREKLKNASRWEVPPDFVAKDLLRAAHNIIAGRYDRA